MSHVDRTRVICRLDELSDNQGRGFTMGSGDWPLRGFVVRRGERVFGYLNRCPHAGHPLNLFPNEFFSPDGDLLLCRSHGARFDATTGVCVLGPCIGEQLRSLPIEIREGYVMLGDDPDSLAAQAG